MRARRRFAQHFLEPTWVDRVIAAAAPSPEDYFLEIGPGRGALTLPLSRRVAGVTAVELDRDLVDWLGPRLPGHVRLVSGDFLALPPEAFLPAGVARQRVRVVGNLPYNVSSPILFRLIELHRTEAAFTDASLMVQREVADRLRAKPGTRQSGVLSILVHLDAEVETVLTLPPGAFRPAPKVWSAVVRLTFRPSPVPVSNRRLFEQVVRSIFSQRRKNLANAIRPLAESLGQDGRVWLGAAGIDPTRRPENLHLTELAALADAVDPSSGPSVV